MLALDDLDPVVLKGRRVSEERLGGRENQDNQYVCIQHIPCFLFDIVEGLSEDFEKSFFSERDIDMLTNYALLGCKCVYN